MHTQQSAGPTQLRASSTMSATHTWKMGFLPLWPQRISCASRSASPCSFADHASHNNVHRQTEHTSTSNPRRARLACAADADCKSRNVVSLLCCNAYYLLQGVTPLLAQAPLQDPPLAAGLLEQAAAPLVRPPPPSSLRPSLQ